MQISPVCSPSHIPVLIPAKVGLVDMLENALFVGPDFIFWKHCFKFANALQKSIDTKVSCYTVFNQANVFT